MKIALLVVVVFSFLGVTVYSLLPQNTASETAKISTTSEIPTVSGNETDSPVLIELFTSEGCSSCPPADSNLLQLEKQANVIALGFHVDYWNRLGWIDQFSKAEYSQRQSFYSNTFKLGEVYTPQMVVDGATQLVGGNLDKAEKAVSTAAENKKGKVALSLAGAKLNISITGLSAHSFANVFLAVAENNLSTNVRNGENIGRNLNHAAVVRDLKVISGIAANAENFQAETVLQIPGDWKRENLKYVVFAQVEDGSRVIAVNQIKAL